MRFPRSLAARLLGAALALATAPAALADTEALARPEPLWLGGEGPLGALALVTLPPGWTSGDAAAVLAAGAWPDPLRHRLSALLLDAGAAVVELRHLDPAPDLHAQALGALRIGFGAGIVVWLAPGAAGPDLGDALAAGYSAAGSLAADAPGFRHASGLPRFEGWPRRATLLCAVLADALDAAPHDFGAACRAGLGAGR
jgi:hypothetical protein